MTRHAILCGSAPNGFTQKKINSMHDFLTSDEGGLWKEKDITIFPNGVTESMLTFVLNRLKSEKIEKILLYTCTLSPVADSEKSVWLNNEEIEKRALLSVLEDSNAQVIFDCDREFLSDEENSDSFMQIEVNALRGVL